MNNDNNEKKDKRKMPRTYNIGGIKFVGKGVWVSELTSIILAAALLTALVYVSQEILRNELAIQDHDAQISALKAERISATHELEIMRERRRMMLLMHEVAGRRIRPETVDRLADLVYTSGKQFGYSPELLLAVMAVESMFDPAALGRYRSGGLSGALGLMQIKYDTALGVARVLGIRGLREEDLFNPEMNMVLGTAYLTMLISQFRDFRLGIMAYNLGQGTVRGHIARQERIPDHYYHKVLVQYYRLKALGDELQARDDAAIEAETRQG